MTPVRHTLAALVLGAALAPTTASACGGFFCDTPPGTQFQSGVVQTRETIVFAVEENLEVEGGSTVEAHVQIAYSGDVDDFAWVLPLPGVPELDVTTDLLFTILRNASAPTYRYTTDVDQNCIRLIDEARAQDGLEDTNTWVMAADSGNFADDDAVADTDGASPGVVVLSTGEVGPYEQTTLQADSAEALTAWLLDNDFDLPANYAAALGGYVVPGNSFVVLKLQKGKQVGDLRPLRLRWPGDAASLPITLTAVAAEDDMPLDVYVLGDHRYVPDNYLHVQINQAAINWRTLGSNRLTLITDAANEAGGQAFATAWAGPHASLGVSQALDANLVPLDDMRSAKTATRLLRGLFSTGLTYDEALLSIFREHLPIDPEVLADFGGVTDQAVYGCPGCWPEISATIPANGDAVVDAIEDEIRAPIRYASSLMDRTPYLTRLESSMSAEEMTADPVFVANPDLPDVAKDHTAQLEVVCYGEASDFVADRKMYLEDGRILQYVPLHRPLWVGDLYEFGTEDLSALPAASLISDHSSSGPGEVLVDKRLDGLPDLWAPSEDLLPLDRKAGGCQVSPAAPTALAFGFGFLLTLSRRRKPLL